MNLDFERARFNMVEQQVRPWEVLDARVLDVLTKVPREDFVATGHRRLAFADVALPLGHDQVMMKPVVEGRLLQALEVLADDCVLEIGTGSGFLAACLSRLGREVLSIDIHADFIDQAQQRLSSAGISNVRLEVADAMRGFDPGRRFKAIAVTGAVSSVPEHFFDWLDVGGRMFVVRGASPAQQAMLYTRTASGLRLADSLFETDLPYLRHAAPPRVFAL